MLPTSPLALPLAPHQEPGQFVEGQAFHSSYVNDKISTRRYGSIAWDDAVMNIINDENVVRLALQPRYLPMLVRCPSEKGRRGAGVRAVL